MIKKSKTVNKRVMQRIVDKLAEGITLTEICQADDMPSYRSITRAVQLDEDLWELYRKGRVQQAEFYTDRINQLAMSPLPDVDDQRKLLLIKARNAIEQLQDEVTANAAAQKPQVVAPWPKADGSA